jgi:CIC family chloride channel protein
MKVSDVLDQHPVLVHEADPVHKAIDYFTANDMLIYPVVNREDKIRGVLTFEAIKDILGDRNTWSWLLVADIMKPMEDSTTADEPLDEVYERMHKYKIDQMPVVDKEDSEKPVGMIDIRTIRLKVHAELLKRGAQDEHAGFAVPA